MLEAYPTDTRAALGAEMLSTLLDSTGDSSVRLAREAVDLLRLGLRARATRIADAGARRLIADGACVAGVLFLAQDLTTALRNRGVPHAVYSSASMAILAVVLALALLGHDRIAGAATLAWMAPRLSVLMAGIHVTACPAMLLPLTRLSIMTVSPRSVRLSDPYGSSWLVVLVVLVVLAGALGGLFARRD